MRRGVGLTILMLAGLGLVGACAGSGPPDRRPITPEMLTGTAPDSFAVAIETSGGTLRMTLVRLWSPAGVDRAYQLFRLGFYDGARIYRMEPGFVAQFGFSGRPAVDSLIVHDYLPPEPVRATNARGTVAYARARPGTRSTQLFINLGDNRRLDMAQYGGGRGYAPIGRIDQGLAVADSFHSGYGSDPPRQDSIARFGNDYLRRHYPRLDSIISTRVIREWSGPEGS